MRIMRGMIRRLALLASLVFALTAAAPRKAAPPLPVPDAARVVLTTELGAITIDLDGKHAPISTGNFLRYVEGRRFDGIVFYRAMRLEWGTQPNGLVQAGVRGDPKRVLKPIAHEPTNVTGVKHTAGAISMARLAPGTATGDFSILLSDMPGLDADPARTSDPDGYAAFGHVVSGMEVVRKIWDAPLSPTEGQGFLRGQMLSKPVKVLTVRRVPLPSTATTTLPPTP